MVKIIKKLPYFNEKEAADLLGMDIMNFRKLRVQGKLELHPVCSDTALYFRPQEVITLADILGVETEGSLSLRQKWGSLLHPKKS
jgi:hypothetical protein